MISISDKIVRFSISLGLLVSSFVHASIINIDEGGQSDYVYGSARVAQPRAYAPSAVSKFDQNAIEKLNIVDVADLFRLFPGVVLSNGSDGVVKLFSYQNPGSFINTKIQVMVDGVTMHWASVGTLALTRLGINIEDIESIEFTRSPSLSVYGENAVFGVMNIITKQPQNTQGHSAHVRLGKDDNYNSFYRFGGQFESTSYRVSITDEQIIPEDLDPLVDPASTTIRFTGDKLERNVLTFRTYTELNLSQNLEIQTKLARADNRSLAGFRSLNDETSDFFLSSSTSEMRDRFLSIKFDHTVSDRVFYEVLATQLYQPEDEISDACFPAILFFPELHELSRVSPQASSQLVNQLFHISSFETFITENNLSGDAANLVRQIETRAIARLNANTGLIKPVCGSVDQSIEDLTSKISINLKTRISDGLRWGTLLSAIDRSADSDQIFQGEVDSFATQLYSNIEYVPTNYGLDNWVFNLGIFWERLDLYSADGKLSNKASVNYLLSPEHSLRMSYSKGYRFPSLADDQMNGKLVLISSNAVELENQGLVNAISNDLKPEKIVTREIGYWGQSVEPISVLKWDVRLFKHHISNEIRAFDFSNIESLVSKTRDTTRDMTGVEFELQYEHESSFTTNLAVAKTNYSDLVDEHTEVRQYSAAGYLLYDLTDSIAGSLSLSGDHIRGGDFKMKNNPVMTFSLVKDYKIDHDKVLNLAFYLRRYYRKEFDAETDYQRTREADVQFSATLEY